MRKKEMSLLTAGAVLMTSAAWAQGPTGEFYLTASDQKQLHVVQGDSVLRTWDQVTPDNREYPIAVVDDVRTFGALGGTGGARYSLDGVDLGDRYPHSIVGSAWDGTTDGDNNYVVDFSNGGVYRFDRDWTNGAKVFDTPGNYLGITYDPTDGTFWISQWGGTMVEHRDMDGNVLSSFSTGFSSISCLALDHADGTLWVGTQGNQGTFTQFSKGGTNLGSVTFGALESENTLGGEFAFGGTGCVYRIKKSKSKRGCENCPAVGDDYASQAECEKKNDCEKKVKTIIACPRGGNGICKIKGKRSSCG